MFGFRRSIVRFRSYRSLGVASMGSCGYLITSKGIIHVLDHSLPGAPMPGEG